jgi:hypothetical protein
VKGIQVALKTAGFDRAALGEIAGIEIQHQPAASKVGQAAIGFHGGSIGSRHHAMELKGRGWFAFGWKHATQSKSLPRETQQAHRGDGESAQKLAALHR